VLLPPNGQLDRPGGCARNGFSYNQTGTLLKPGRVY
jgi:hypothetical protein